MTSAIWLFCLSMFLILHHDLPPFSIQFLGCLSIWMTLLVFFSLFIQTYKFSENNDDPSKLIRDVYLIISVLSYPFFLMWVYKAMNSGDTDSWTMNLRLAAIGQSSVSKEIYGGLHIVIWEVSFLIELIYFSRKKWYRLAIPTFFYLTLGFFTMSKAVFLNLFIMAVCVLYLRKTISLKHLLIGFSVLFFLFAGLQSVRHAADMQSASSKEDFAVLYLLSSMSAFDTVQPASSPHFGENVFRLSYAVTNKLGISDVKPINPILEWIQHPISTNTYTGMYPFFKDFGYMGVIIFAIFFGCLFGWIFKKTQNGSPFYVILYSYFTSILLMQYVAEMLFTNLSGNLKFIVILWLPFFATKYNLFDKRKFTK
jgi:oligosaccharide repeat unit polymerase